MNTIKVGNPQYGQLHQYKDVRGVMHMKCSGEWFPLADAPCHVAALRALPEPEELPPCEVNDEDLAAMREVLGNPNITICTQKGRASWNDVVISPDTVQTSVALRQLIQRFEDANPGLVSVAGLKDLAAS